VSDKLPWFKHESSDRNSGGAKALRAQYGFEGYGRFDMLREIIAEQPGARLDLSLKKNRSGYAGELGLKPDEFESFLTFLADPDECGLLHYENGTAWSEDLDKDLAQLEKKRNLDQAAYTRKKGPDSEKPNSESEITSSDSEKADSDNGKIPTNKQTVVTNIHTKQRATSLTKSGENDEVARPPAVFDFFGMREELKKSGIVFSEPDLARIGKRLGELGIQDGEKYAAYVVERSKKANPHSLGGYVKTALLKYENWADEFKACEEKKDDPPLPPSGPCPVCGEPRAHWPGDPLTKVRCIRCKAVATFDESKKAWEQEEPAEKPPIQNSA
jgi:hypothetical protein